MKPAFEYKGYLGSAEVNIVDNVVHGKLLFITDIVTYISDDIKKLKSAFEEAVDDYIQTCAELGDEPNIPFKGTFNVRVGPDRHKKAALASTQQNKSLNDWICQSIDSYLALAQDRPITNNVTVNLYAPQQHEQRIASNKQPGSWEGQLVAVPSMHVQPQRNH